LFDVTEGLGMAEETHKTHVIDVDAAQHLRLACGVDHVLTLPITLDGLKRGDVLLISGGGSQQRRFAARVAELWLHHDSVLALIAERWSHAESTPTSALLTELEQLVSCRRSVCAPRALSSTTVL
jgi:hypothetical protein